MPHSHLDCDGDVSFRPWRCMLAIRASMRSTLRPPGARGGEAERPRLARAEGGRTAGSGRRRGPIAWTQILRVQNPTSKAQTKESASAHQEIHHSSQSS